MSENYYQILNISPSASQQDIKGAYRRLCFIYHPDRCTTAFKSRYEEKLKKINQAYGVLSDDNLKANYDKRLIDETYKPQTYKHESPKSEKKRHYKNSAHEFVCSIYDTIKNERNRKRKFFLIAGLLCVLAQPLYGIGMIVFSFFETKQVVLENVRHVIYKDLDSQFKNQFNTLTHTGE